MILIFESILPIFLLIIMGVLLKRMPILDRNFWSGLETLGYYVLFPPLLFITLHRADFGEYSIGNVGLVFVASLLILLLLTLLSWIPLKRLSVSKAQYSTVFQTSIRFNGFISLAIADKLYGEPGLALVAIAIGILVIPINIVSVTVMLIFSDKEMNLRSVAFKLISNPLIIACVAGLASRYLPNGIYAPALQTLDIVASTALGMGLIAVGAALRMRDAMKLRIVAVLPIFFKLILMPTVSMSLGIYFGLSQSIVILIVICTAVPTAMNGYLLAKKMGGDADLYAATATMQTAVSFFTIPLMVELARSFS